MNRQEIYNTAITHVQEQKRPAVNEDGVVMYKFEDESCPIGALIPDDVYSDEMERHSVDCLIEDFPEVATSFDVSIDDGEVESGEVEFLYAIQSAYDYAVLNHKSEYQTEFVSMMEKTVLPLIA